MLARQDRSLPNRGTTRYCCTRRHTRARGRWDSKPGSTRTCHVHYLRSECRPTLIPLWGRQFTCWLINSPGSKLAWNDWLSTYQSSPGPTQSRTLYISATGLYVYLSRLVCFVGYGPCVVTMPCLVFYVKWYDCCKKILSNFRFKKEGDVVTWAPCVSPCAHYYDPRIVVRRFVTCRLSACQSFCHTLQGYLATALRLCYLRKYVRLSSSFTIYAPEKND